MVKHQSIIQEADIVRMFSIKNTISIYVGQPVYIIGPNEAMYGEFIFETRIGWRMLASLMTGELNML